MALPDLLAEHLKKPQPAELLGSQASGGQASNAACGDELRVELARDERGRLQVGYRVRGCGALIGVTSLCVARLQGLDAAQLGAFDVASLVEQAGGLDRRSAHAARVFARALTAACEGLR